MALRKKLFSGALLLLAGLSLFIFLIWITTPKPQKFVSANGVITIEDCNFTTNRVEYRYPESILDHSFVRTITKPIRKHLPRPKQTRVGARPQFAGERLLTCAFLINFSPPENSFVGRVAVRDENGNEFDPVSQGGGATIIGGIPTFYLAKMSVFPRRGETLTLKLKRNAETIAEFQIPNPAYRDYPQWTPSTIPISAKSGDFEMKLTDFAAERPKEYKEYGTGTIFPATRCGFQLLQNGVPTTNWSPHKAEILDATGNHWMAFWYRNLMYFVDSTLYLQFFGALWPGEDAWKLRISFQQHADFSDKDLIRFDDLPVPTGAEIVRPRLVHEEPDARFELLGLFGPETSYDQARAVFMNINPRAGMVTIAFKARLAEYDRAFRFVRLTDENGKEIVATEVTNHAIGHESNMPYLVHAKVPPGVKKLSLVCALPKTRTFEFMAKPAQP